MVEGAYWLLLCIKKVMKEILILAVFITGSVLLNGQSVKKTGANCELGIKINTSFSKAAALDSVMQSYSPALLPGTAIALYSEAEG